MELASFSYGDLKNINYKNFFKRLYNKALVEEDLMSGAAQVAFYFAFALFPLLLFLVTVFGIVLGSADDMREQLFSYLGRVMPYSALDLVKKTLTEVSEGSSGGKLTFGLLVALYSASAGIDNIRIALNGVYNLTEERSWFKTKSLSVLLTLILALLIFIALGIVFYGGRFLTLVLDTINLPIPSPFVLSILQVVTVIIVLLTVFALLYGYLPNHRQSKWVWITPGAITGILLWVAVSFAFKTYLGYFDSYNKTYGSLGAMIILMLWLYLTALVILFGGAINAVLQEFTDPQTAEAGLTKAVAKEISENPDVNTVKEAFESDRVKELSGTIRAEVPSGESETKDDKSESKKLPDSEESALDFAVTGKPYEPAKIKTSNVKNAASQTSIPFNLLVGTAFGFLAGVIFKNKKDKE